MKALSIEMEKKLFNLFKKAAESERRAQKMYKDIIETLEDKDLKEIFQGFYEDEIRHEKIVMQRYNELRKKLEEIYKD